MGHRISAVILHGAFNAERAAKYGMVEIPLKFELTMFPLEAGYCDHWSERLGAAGGSPPYAPLLDCPVVHHLVNDISDEPLFAIVETDYFGGNGDQAAVVYSGGRAVLAPRRRSTGPINEALRALGVRAIRGLDEFDTIGLGQYRSFDDHFERYAPNLNDPVVP